MSYDDKAMEVFRTFANQLNATGLSMFDVRLINGIANAIEMQIEEGRAGSEAIAYLIKALHAEANAYGKLKANIITAAIRQLESAVMQKQK